jgi:glucosamine--fructose-6-phosphate aminotransferase (isomerizing)
MCGIIGYIGYKKAVDIIMSGLKILEYRGYDSSGIAIMNILNEPIRSFKKVGLVEELESILPKDIIGVCGIGHTRWATHGGATEENSHPHLSPSGKFAVVHNGIFEHYAKIRHVLEKKGIMFKGQTDTEVFAALLEEFYNNICAEKILQHGKTYTELSVEEKKEICVQSVRVALQEMGGSYAVGIMFNEIETLIAARTSNQLIIGIGQEENFLASDPSAIIQYVNDFIYLKEGDVAIISGKKVGIMNLNGESVSRSIEQASILQAEPSVDKGDYPYYMLKEIYEQPDTLSKLINYNINSGHFLMYKGIKKPVNEIKLIRLLACGSAYNAALYGRYLLEKIAKIPTIAEIASEFIYREPVLPEGTLVIVVSQSGETADTIEALRLAKMKGAYSLGVVNVPCSTITREVDEVFYLHSGQEIGVASTKAFTGMLLALSIFSIWLGNANGALDETTTSLLISEIERLPELCQEALGVHEEIKLISERYKSAKSFNFLARGLQYPSALEGALKFKELSYHQASGYPAGELKHGPLSLIDEHIPSVVISTNYAHYNKVLSNIQEILARKGPIIVVATEGNTDFTISNKLTKESEKIDVLYVRDVHEIFEPVLTAIPLQLLAYETAVALGNNVDHPRNLAKSVTVE